MFINMAAACLKWKHGTVTLSTEQFEYSAVKKPAYNWLVLEYFFSHFLPDVRWSGRRPAGLTS